MRCKTCNTFTLIRKECKQCRKDKEEQWEKDHTFVNGEEVLVHLDDDFYGKPLKGKIIDKHFEIIGCDEFGTTTWLAYEVKLENGKRGNINRTRIEKIKGGDNDRNKNP